MAQKKSNMPLIKNMAEFSEISDKEQTFSFTGGLLKKAIAVREINVSLKEKTGLLAAIGKKEMQASKAEISNVIQLKNGVFTINSNVETSAVKVDPFLKQLVESVLK